MTCEQNPISPKIPVKYMCMPAHNLSTNFIFRWKVSELIINGVQRQDDGLYECQARNEGGQFFKSGHIQVCTFSWNTRFWHFFCSLKFLNKCSVVKNSAYFLSMCNSKRHTDFDIRYHEGIFFYWKSFGDGSSSLLNFQLFFYLPQDLGTIVYYF